MIQFYSKQYLKVDFLRHVYGTCFSYPSQGCSCQELGSSKTLQITSTFYFPQWVPSQGLLDDADPPEIVHTNK